MKREEEIPSSIDMYINAISRIPLLTKEEEFETSTNIVKYRKRIEFIGRKLKKNNSPNLRKRLHYNHKKYGEYTRKMIEGNYRLVISIAKKYYNQFLQITDLIEEGNLGLIKAVSRFNPNRGYRFSTFAIWWIRQSIVKSIRDKGKIVKIPVYVKKAITSYRQSILDYTHKHGVQPCQKEIQEMLNINAKKLQNLSNIPDNFVSLNHQIGDSEQEIEETIIDSSKSFNPVEKSIENSLEGTLALIMEKLTDREKQIICMRYGLNNQEPMVLNKIGLSLNITRERVRQIHAGALRKMREFGQKEELKVFLR